uniref:Uncharacterized protein n=1 Tax=Quercus lobata TaxID=97700 RepID=A0A7N2LW31_QUELO
MRSSPVVHSVLTQSDSFSKPSHSGRNSCDSEIQLDTVDELQSDKSSFKHRLLNGIVNKVLSFYFLPNRMNQIGMYA